VLNLNNTFDLPKERPTDM